MTFSASELPEDSAPATNEERGLFLGFPYREPHLTLYGEKVATRVQDHGWKALMPFGGAAEGLMLDRIAAMIRGAERAVYEVGVENSNVWFELGISLGCRQPVALTSSSRPHELPDILRSPWLRPFADDDACLNEVLGFLALPNARAMVPAQRTRGDPSRIAVIGNDSRTAGVASAVRQSGRDVVEIAPAEIRSMSEAVDIAGSFGVLVVVRPQTESWHGHSAIAALVTLGTGFELGRHVVLAAGPSEAVPSDCIQLLIRGADDSELATLVRTSIERPRPAARPTGTTRPRISGALPREQRKPIAVTLRGMGRGLLDAEPGYGKTTLLVQVADELQWPTAWLVLEHDWSTSELLERLVVAVGEHVPAFGWDALATVREAQRTAEKAEGRTSYHPFPQPEQLAEMLALHAHRASTPDHVLLMVDDVHTASDECGRLLARLAAVAPGWLQLLFAGRGAAAAISRMAATGFLPTWHADELRFSPEETSAYLREAVPGVDQACVELLHERTEGWQAALAVIRAWLTVHPDASIQQLGNMARGDRHQIYQIFAVDYFGGLASSRQQDLLTAALPIRLDPTAIRHLFGDRGGLLLRELTDGPYFLTEDEAGVFRLHSLFREFLGQRWIDERGRESLHHARSVLARWYLDEGHTADAYQVGCEAEDWETAASAIEPVIRAFASRGDAYFVLDLAERLPETRIRSSRPIWESWVRALTHTGNSRALAEAERLAGIPAPDPCDQAVADLTLAEIRYERGVLTDHGYAEVCDQIADRLGDDEPASALAVQARLTSVAVRAVRSADAEEWRSLHKEALAVADEAERLGLPSGAAVACATAGDMASREFETTFTSDFADLRFVQSMGYEVSLLARVERARPLVELSRKSSELYKRAFALAEQAEEPIVAAQVQISFSRFLTLNVANGIWRSGVLDEAARTAGEQAIACALQAADTYSRHGNPRSVVIALNAAAEAARALDDTGRLEEYGQQAVKVARKYGYDDLAATADGIRTSPTVQQLYEAAANPLPLHRLDAPQRHQYIQELISRAGLTADQDELVRPVLQRTMAAEVDLSARQEEVCQHLAILRDLRGPRIGPFDIEDPMWSVTCRMRGLSSTNRHRRAQPLLRQFISAFCWNCGFRSPGNPPPQSDNSEGAIYAPLIDRLAAEGDDQTLA